MGSLSDFYVDTSEEFDQRARTIIGGGSWMYGAGQDHIMRQLVALHEELVDRAVESFVT